MSATTQRLERTVAPWPATRARRILAWAQDGSLRNQVLVALLLVLALRIIFAAVLMVSCANDACGSTVPNWMWFRLPPATSGWQGFLAGPWMRNDAVYYAQIAVHAYTPAVSVPDPLGVFYPFFPMLSRVLLPVTAGDPVVAGLLVNTVLTVAAIALLYTLARDELGVTAAARARLLLVLSPAAFFLLAPMSEAAFLTFTVAAVLAARRGRILLASILAIGATLSRDQGILVVIPLAFAVLERWRDRHREQRFPLQWSDAGLLLAPLSFVGFQWYLWGHGWPGGSFQAEAVFMHAHAAPPWVALWQSIVVVVTRFDAPEFINLATVALVALSLPLMWRRLRRADTAYTAASLLIILFHVGGYSPLEFGSPIHDHHLSGVAASRRSGWNTDEATPYGIRSRHPYAPDRCRRQRLPHGGVKGH